MDGSTTRCKRRGVWRALARLKLVVEEALVDLMADLDQRLPVVLGESSADAEVAGVVDGRLGPERAALFEVLLDLRGAVVHLDRRLHAFVEDLGVKPPRRPAGDAAAEHDRDLVGAPERELVGQGALKPRPPRRGAVEHAGVGDLGLAERELVAVAARAILRGQRRGQRAPASGQRTPARRRPDRLAQISASAAGSSQAANPLSNGLNSIPRWAACRLAHSFPFRYSHTENGAYAVVLRNAGPQSGSRMYK